MRGSSWRSHCSCAAHVVGMERRVSSSLSTSSDFLSVMDAFSFAKGHTHAGHRPPHPSPRRTAAGLSLTLPPLCTWAASSVTSSAASSAFYPASIPRRRLSGRNQQVLCQQLEAYVDAVETPPLFVVLRLFPDLSIVHLKGRSSGGKDRRGRQKGVLHEYPLDTFLSIEEPWGPGVDPQQVFRSALADLEELAAHFLPRFPLLLQLPTRLLVSQQFLHELASLLTRVGWRSIAWELPLNHQLDIAPHEGSVAESELADSSWCRLSTLSTPWTDLCRHQSYGATLRQLRQDDRVPLHALFSWATADARLFAGLEQGLVLDTTPVLSREQQAAPPPPARHGPLNDDGARGTTFYMDEDPTRRLDAQRGQDSALLKSPPGVLRPLPPIDAAAPSLRKSCHPTAELSLDAPPDHLRALILESVAVSPSGAASPDQDEGGRAERSTNASRHLIKKFGQLIQHSFSQEADDASDSASQTALEREAAELEQLLRSADQASGYPQRNASGRNAVEEMLSQMQQSLSDWEVQRGGGVQGTTHLSSARDESGSAALSRLDAAADGVENARHGCWDGAREYWTRIYDLECQLMARFIMTTPTYHLGHVEAWKAGYHGSRRVLQGSLGTRDVRSSTFSKTTNDSRPLLTVFHNLLPVLPPMEVEVERLLREGHVSATPPLPSAMPSSSSSLSLAPWLPPDINAALSTALHHLPAAYQICERRRVLRPYHDLRRNGVMGSSRSGAIGNRPDTVEDDYQGDDAETVLGNPPSSGDSWLSSEGLVRIRAKPRDCELFRYAPPSRVAKEREDRLTNCNPASPCEKDSSGAGLPGFVPVSDVETLFEKSLMQSIAAQALSAGPSPASPPPRVLSIPHPGISTSQLNCSWQLAQR